MCVCVCAYIVYIHRLKKMAEAHRSSIVVALAEKADHKSDVETLNVQNDDVAFAIQDKGKWYRYEPEDEKQVMMRLHASTSTLHRTETALSQLLDNMMLIVWVSTIACACIDWQVRRPRVRVVRRIVSER